MDEATDQYKRLIKVMRQETNENLKKKRRILGLLKKKKQERSSIKQLLKQIDEN